MHSIQNSPQVLTAGPATWQQVNPGTTVSPVTSNEPAQRRGASGRICSSLFQAILGVLLIVFGIIAVSVAIPDTLGTSSFSSYRIRRIDQRDRQSWGIWCGAIFILTSLFGLCSKKNQVMISLYMAFSIVASVLAFCGIVVSIIQIAVAANVKRDVEDSSPFDNFNRFYNFYDDFQLDRVTKILSTHLACYAIMLICFVAEFIVSIVGATFTCSGLDCCSAGSNQRVVYYQTQVHQFPGQPVPYTPPQPFPVGGPLPAGTAMVPVASNVQQGPIVTQFFPQNRYVTAPPPYQSDLGPQGSTPKDMRIRPLPSAPPTYESALQIDDTQSSQNNPGSQGNQGDQGSNDAEYLEVIQ